MTRWLTIIVFAGSMFVLLEPAPFDLAAAAICLFLLVSGRATSVNLGVLWSLLFIFTIIRAGTLFAVDEWSDAIRFFGITTYLTIGCAIYAGYVARVGPNAIQYAVWGLYIGTAVTAIAIASAMAGILPIREIVFYGSDRAKGFYKDPNVMGPAAIAVAVFSFAAFGQATSALAKAMHAAVFLIATWLVFMSFSRGAWLAYLSSLLILIVANPRRHGSRKSMLTAMTGLVLAALALIVVVYSMGMLGLTEFTSQRLAAQSYDSDRFTVQEAFIEKALANPIGYGPGQANAYSERVGAAASGAAHSTYVRVAFEYGWIGMLVFALILINSLSLALRGLATNSNEKWLFAAALASLGGILVSSLAVDTLHWRHLWVVIAFIWGLSAWQQQGKITVVDDFELRPPTDAHRGAEA